ncbi:MAG: PHP domain-containing protein, partial [Phycisphaerae bacterium]
MSNRALSDILNEIADLLEINGDDGFRVNSYRRAARTIRDLTKNIGELANDGGLDKLPGIGKALRAKVEQFLAAGRIDKHQELKDSVPSGLPALLRIPGMGPKKVRLVWQELGVESLDSLAAAVDDGRVAGVKGMGPKTAEQIGQGIAFLKRSSGRTALGLAWPLAQELAEAVRAIPNVQRVEVVGSLRRGAETVGDLDLVCESTDGAAVVKAFTQLPAVVRVLGGGDTKGSVIVRSRDGKEVQAQLRVIPRKSYGAALQYFTGSKEHNVRLRERAVKKKWKLNEWGLFDGKRHLAGADEANIYRKLGLPFIPPELREDRGEFAGGLTLPKLIERSDIRGDLHMHTSASDGVLTAAEMAKAAAALGYQYIAITDHSRSSTIANGLSIDRMWRQIEKLRKLNERLDTISVLVGCECDVLGDGALDYPDRVLAACDLVVASVHG